MSPDEVRYYGERAEAERPRAAGAASQLAAEIHLEMASLYEKLVKLEQTPSHTLHIAEAMARQAQARP